MTGQLLDVFEKDDGNGEKMVDEGAPVYPSFRDMLGTGGPRKLTNTDPEVNSDIVMTRAGPCRNLPQDPVDWVKRPPHYTQGKIDVWDFILDQNLGFLEGNAVKYICRAKYKGDELQDLKKAVENIEKRIEQLEQIRRSGETT
jgi:hypothetical protein